MNLYIHFPFCRSKCDYCALHSVAGRSETERQLYVARVVRDLDELLRGSGEGCLTTLYFGGGTPALCDLRPLLRRLDELGRFAPGYEFTVELNPLDVSDELLETLRAGGVNRLSMGVQSLDDAVLRGMGRAHTADQALAAWRLIRAAGFDNAGIDLICGWPGGQDHWRRTLDAAAELAPDHCSVYTLILEPGTRLAQAVAEGRITLPTDDNALAELAAAERMLADIGLERYEISSFAKPGKECRHNLAVWLGEDYVGIGDGACSREGNVVSRVIFRLRLLREGFNPARAAVEYPELAPRVQDWRAALDRFVGEGLLTRDAGSTYRLTRRGTEVCDTILAELV